jgi:aldehyde dehydrogenase (NAD+)
MPEVDLAQHEKAAELLPKVRLIIGEQDLEAGTGGTFDHIDPATERVNAIIPMAGPKEIDDAVAAAEAAFETWGSMRQSERRRLLVRFATLVEDRIGDFARVAPLENGLPITGFDMGHGPVVREWTSYYAGWADKIEGVVSAAYSPDEFFEYSIGEPYGVIGHIITWNAPAMSLAMKVPASLAAGNTVVIKPSELTPFSATLWAELAREADLPPGVINVVPGSGEAGEALVRHRGVQKISFTGGVKTARQIMATASETLKPLVFELGGKSANLMFEDVDIPSAALWSLAYGMGNTGQGCADPTRLLVQASIYDEVVETVKAVALGMPIGDPLDPSMVFGPVINDVAVERILGFVDRAQEHGYGRLVCGGKRMEGTGYFVEPTVFADVEPDSELAQQEIFGPVLSIIRFDDEEQAIELANGTNWGLSAALQTRDVDRVNRIVRRLHAGTVFVNQGPNPVTCASSPFGGLGDSGFGREGGKPGLDEFIRLKGVGVGHS